MIRQTVNDTNSVARALKRARRQGLVVVALAIVFGFATAGWLAGWFGPSISTLSTSLSIRASERAEMPRPRQGLVPTSDNKGQILFGRYCDSCHPGGKESKGVDLLGKEFRRDFQTEAQVSQLVRDGTCKMPAYNRFFLADADLADIAKFTLARAKGAGSADPSPPLPPLDGQRIFQEKCISCHNTIDAPLDPRDVQVIYALDEMAKCAGITTEQKTTLRSFLVRSQQGR